MNITVLYFLLSFFIILCIKGESSSMSAFSHNEQEAFQSKKPDITKLPEPRYTSSTSLEKAIAERRSVREYGNKPLTLAEISQLLWAAQGVTSPSGYRTAPSGGALYPLEVYAIIGNAEGIEKGIYKYKPQKHEVIKVKNGDVRNELSRAALGQTSVADGAVSFVITAVYERTTRKYGDRGIRYVYMEAGHAAQNVCLQAVSLGIGTVVVGAFRDDEVKKVISMSDDERPLYIIPAGKK